MALQIPVMKYAKGKEKSELEKMEEIQQKLESVFSNLTDVMAEVDTIVSELIRKDEERRIWSDFGEGIDDDPEDDIDPEFSFDFDSDCDNDYDPDDVYKFDFGDIDRIYAEMKKDASAEADDEYDEEEEEIRAAWSGWDEFAEENV